MGIFSTTSLKTVARLLIALVLLASSAIAQAQSMSDAGSCRADVVFLMDNTGSMGGPIRNTKRNASKILDAISGGDPLAWRVNSAMAAPSAALSLIHI